MNSVQNLFASSTGSTTETIATSSLDTIILIVVFLVLLIYGMKFGKRRIISLILSFYISIPIINFFPYSESISFFGDTEKAVLYSQIGFFALVIVFINIILERVVILEIYSSGARKLIENIFLALAGSGLLISISYHIISISELHDFAEQIDLVFASSVLFFWWLMVPLVVIFFTARR